MLTVTDLLSQAKAAKGIPSNYRLARVLGVPDQTVNRWSTGRNCPDDETSIILAEMAGLDPAEVVASITAQRHSDGRSADVWRTIAERAHRGAVAAFVLACGVTFTGGPDGGAMASHGASAPPTCLFLWQQVCILCQLIGRGFSRLCAVAHRRPPSTWCSAFSPGFPRLFS